MTVATSQPPKQSRVVLQLAVLLAVCVVVYWFRLGEGGFFGTEAHRAVPAYEMLEHAQSLDDWLVPRMFEQPYLRKPPGMPWAIAGMSAIFGETVFAARAVSALSCTLMAFLAFVFARRWFGPQAGLPAGLAQTLMPVLWETGRSAEIEPLNNLGTQIAALLLIEALIFAKAVRNAAVPEPSRHAQSLASAVGHVATKEVPLWFGAAFGIAWFMLAKGPASAPVVLAIIGAACIVRRSPSPLFESLGPISIATMAALVLGNMTLQAMQRETVGVILQSPSAFMFEPGMILGVLTLPLVAFASMLPASFALLFPWGPDAQREADAGAGLEGHGFRIARTLAIAWILSILIYMAFGVRNPRYTLPAACLLPPLAGAYLAGIGAWLTPKRASIAKMLVLGRPAVLAGVLLIASAGYMFTVEANRRATSGSNAGTAIGDALADWIADNPGPVTVIADEVIEARPEVVLMMQRRLADRGAGARVHWLPMLETDRHELPDHARTIALLRTDPGGRESGVTTINNHPIRRLSVAPESQGWGFHKYRADLYLVLNDPFAN